MHHTVEAPFSNSSLLWIWGRFYGDSSVFMCSAIYGYSQEYSFTSVNGQARVQLIFVKNIGTAGRHCCKPWAYCCRITHSSVPSCEPGLIARAEFYVAPKRKVVLLRKHNEELIWEYRHNPLTIGEIRAAAQNKHADRDVCDATKCINYDIRARCSGVSRTFSVITSRSNRLLQPINGFSSDNMSSVYNPGQCVLSKKKNKAHVILSHPLPSCAFHIHAMLSIGSIFRPNLLSSRE